MATKKNNKKSNKKSTSKTSKKKTNKAAETKVYQMKDIINEPLPFSNIQETEPAKVEENISTIPEPTVSVVVETTPSTTPDIYEKLPEEDNVKSYNNSVIPKINETGDMLFIIGGILILLGLLALLAV